MTKDEIKALIDAKITGQGTQVDVGGALPQILKEIIDISGSGEGGGKSILEFGPTTDLRFFQPMGNRTAEEVAEYLGITVQQLDDLLAYKYDLVKTLYDECPRICEISVGPDMSSIRLEFHVWGRATINSLFSGSTTKNYPLWCIEKEESEVEGEPASYSIYDCFGVVTASDDPGIA